jgi:hypothetical protein
MIYYLWRGAGVPSDDRRSSGARAAVRSSAACSECGSGMRSERKSEPFPTRSYSVTCSVRYACKAFHRSFKAFKAFCGAFR